MFVDKKVAIVKLEDVAAKAKVSIATASIVLNTTDSRRVSAATRKRVMDAAQELQYRPASYAQQMRGKNPTILGLIIPDLMNQFYPEVTCGFSNHANTLGYNVVLLNSRNDIDREEFFIETLIGMRVAGVALCGVYSTHPQDKQREKELIKRLMSLDIPVVCLDRYDEAPICPYVGIDNYKAGYCMTEKLIEAGHKNIALFEPHLSLHIVEERCRGYYDAMNKYNLTPASFKSNQMDFTDIPQQMEAMLQSRIKFTALFNAGSDMGAIECIKYAVSKGVRIPQDMSIAGFDDIYLANIVNPSLTTICQPKYEIGKSGLKLLAQMIENKKLTEQNIVLPYEYVQRNSTCNIN